MISNGAENSALPSQKLIQFQNVLKYKIVILNSNNISQYDYFYCIFDQNKCDFYETLNIYIYIYLKH